MYGIISKNSITLSSKNYIATYSKGKLRVGKKDGDLTAWFKIVNIKLNNFKEIIQKLEEELNLRVGNLI